MVIDYMQTSKGTLVPLEPTETDLWKAKVQEVAGCSEYLYGADFFELQKAFYTRTAELDL